MYMPKKVYRRQRKTQVPQELGVNFSVLITATIASILEISIFC